VLGVKTVQNNRNLLLILIAAAVLILCCCCAVIGVGGALLALRAPAAPSAKPLKVVTRMVTTTPAAPRVTPAPPALGSATVQPETSATPANGGQPGGAGEAVGIPTLDAESAALLANTMPAADQRDLELRLNPDGGDIPIVVNATPPSYKVGDKAQFWVSNSDTQEHHQVTAELRYMTDHVAMWVEQGVKFNQKDLEASANRFEQKTYPTNREFFGSEWTPGVDNDVRLHILHARGLGDTVAGYYSSADEYSTKVNQYSNEREMFYVSADSGNAKPNSEFYDGTLAHEFQHMIHWANDRNEDSWVNEGMSELASYLNHFDPGGSDQAYAEVPDTQLNTWSDPSLGNAAHYGASYLFMSYFLDRFGEDLTKAVVASPQNGIAGFDEALQKAGRPERFDDIYADWVIANYLDAPNADSEGRYGYSNIDLAPMAVSETYTKFPAQAEAQVSQYGVDYIRLQGGGPITIDFTGQTQVGLMDTKPQGTYSWWSNRGDQSDSTLTRAFDLRDAKSATLNFSAWYNIEDGWDYAYVEASTDGGQTWKILPGGHTTEKNPVGNAFGPGWTGLSGYASGDKTEGKTAQWIEEKVDLTPFAGKEIQVRFEMVTDDAVNQPGLLIDNISIPEIGYKDDGESGTGGWTADGWTLTDNSLAQRWLVQLLEVSKGQVTVQRMVVGPDGRGQLTVPDLGNLDEAMLTISGLTPVTTEPAQYSYTITQQ
jgi:immune inhibitor A